KRQSLRSKYTFSAHPVSPARPEAHEPNGEPARDSLPNRRGLVFRSERRLGRRNLSRRRSRRGSSETPLPRSSKAAPGSLVGPADRAAALQPVDRERGERARLEWVAGYHSGQGPAHRRPELESLAVAAGEDVETGDPRHGAGQGVAVGCPRVEPDPG